MSRENEARPSGRASVAVAESVTKVSGLEGADTQRRGYVQPKQLPALLKAAEGAAARARAAVAGRRSRERGFGSASASDSNAATSTSLGARSPFSARRRRQDGVSSISPQPCGKSWPYGSIGALQAADRPGVPDREGRPRLPPERAAAAAGEGGREGQHAAGEGGDRAEQRGGPAWPAPHVRDAAMRDR